MNLLELKALKTDFTNVINAIEKEINAFKTEREELLTRSNRLFDLYCSSNFNIYTKVPITNTRGNNLDRLVEFVNRYLLKKYQFKVTNGRIRGIDIVESGEGILKYNLVVDFDITVPGLNDAFYIDTQKQIEEILLNYFTNSQTSDTVNYIYCPYKPWSFHEFVDKEHFSKATTQYLENNGFVIIGQDCAEMLNTNINEHINTPFIKFKLNPELFKDDL